MSKEYEKLVKVWMQAHKERRTAGWVADELKTSRQNLYNKLARLRMDGVDLPALQNRRNQPLYDVKKINKILKEK